MLRGFLKEEGDGNGGTGAAGLFWEADYAAPWMGFGTPNRHPLGKQTFKNGGGERDSRPGHMALGVRGKKHPEKWTRSKEVGRWEHKEFIFDDTFKSLKKWMLFT